jgi:hypothetical protein
MSRGLAATVDRLLAYGHALLKGREPIGKIDVLTEITVAVCDLFPPSNLPDDRFWLSDVRLIRNGREIEVASNLTPFDIENGIRNALQDICPPTPIKIESPRRSGETTEFRLVVPGSVPEEFQKELAPFWKQALRDLGSDIEGIPAQYCGAVQNVDPKDDQDVLLTLRQILDTVAEGDTNVYTLQVHRSGEHFCVSKNHRVDFALGYWLPSSRLFSLVTENGFGRKEIDDLEQLLKPLPREILVTQSHSNVYTRKAGLVRNQAARKSYLAGKLQLDETTRAKLSRVDELEKKVWGETEPVSVFMMPLVSYGCSGSESCTLTTGHCYLALRDRSPNVEELITRRYRAVRAFTDGMYQRYCETVAKALARRIIDGDTTDLEQLASKISALYHVPSKILVKDPATVGCDSPSLAERLRTLRTTLNRQEGPEDEASWGPRVDLILKSLTLRWEHAARPTEETDVLGRLGDSLELETGRRDAPIRSLRERGLALFNQLIEVLTDAQKITDGLRTSIDYPRAPWATVRQMRILHESSTEYVCLSQGDPIRPQEGWEFRKGHSFHTGEQTCDCLKEASRRVAFLFGATPPERDSQPETPQDYSWPAGATHQQRDALAFVTFCEKCGLSPGEWIKRSCEKGSELASPSVAALVTLLFLLGARVRSDAVVRGKYRHKADREPLGSGEWTLSLSGIASLSKQGTTRSEIELAFPTGGGIEFVLGKGKETILEYDKWLDPCRQDLVGKPLNPADHSRRKEIAAAYMCTEGCLPPPQADGRIGNISLRVKDRHLYCTWHCPKWRPPH